MNYRVIDFDVHGDSRGKLVALENLKEIPFEVKRVYYMFDTLPNESRGFHAHKNLEQIIIAMDGACRFILDDGKKLIVDIEDMKDTLSPSRFNYSAYMQSKRDICVFSFEGRNLYMTKCE